MLWGLLFKEDNKVHLESVVLQALDESGIDIVEIESFQLSVSVDQALQEAYCTELKRLNRQQSVEDDASVANEHHSCLEGSGEDPAAVTASGSTNNGAVKAEDSRLLSLKEKCRLIFKSTVSNALSARAATRTRDHPTITAEQDSRLRVSVSLGAFSASINDASRKGRNKKRKLNKKSEF